MLFTSYRMQCISDLDKSCVSCNIYTSLTRYSDLGPQAVDLSVVSIYCGLLFGYCQFWSRNLTLRSIGNRHRAPQMRVHGSMRRKTETEIRALSVIVGRLWRPLPLTPHDVSVSQSTSTCAGAPLNAGRCWRQLSYHLCVPSHFPATIDA